jgi:hypothetical protein
VKTKDESWFKILIEQVTSPVVRDVPEPFRFRPSFEVLELDYFVHKDVQVVLPPNEGVPLDRVADTSAATPTSKSNLLLGLGTISSGSTITTRGYILALDGNFAVGTDSPMYVIPPDTVGVVTIGSTASGPFVRLVSGGLTYQLCLTNRSVNRTTPSVASVVEVIVSSVTAADTDGIIGYIPGTSRKKQIIKKKPQERHVYAADILDHVVDQKFEQLYWNDKGKVGFTLPGHKYEGPGNSLNNGEPTDETDAMARKHDLQYAWAAYQFVNGRIDKATYDSKIHEADEELIQNANLTSFGGIAANLVLRAKKFIEHFTGIAAPKNSIGRYEADTDSELISRLLLHQQPDYVSSLKEHCDKWDEELEFSYKRLESPDNCPLYECVCKIGDYSRSATEIGKKKAKQAAAHIMLLSMADSRYQSDIDAAAAQPAVAHTPMPPVAVASSSALAVGQTVGTIYARNQITEHDYVPITTVNVVATPANNDMILKMRIHPGNLTSGGQESQAQMPFRNHVFSGPTIVDDKIAYLTFKITTAANAYQAFRLIAAHIPLEYTAAQIDALKATDLKQFPNKEVYAHGSEVKFVPGWVNRLPVIVNHATDPSNTNGWLVIKILENSLVTDSTSPKLTLWVCANAVVYSMPRTPAALPAVST